MGRKKLVEVLAEKVKQKVKNDDGMYLVVYDTYRSKYPKELYQRITDLQKMGYMITRIQRSVYLCKGLQAAVTLAELVKPYNTEVKIFKVEKEVFTEM